MMAHDFQFNPGPLQVPSNRPAPLSSLLRVAHAVAHAVVGVSAGYGVDELA
jgi:hypothetical protein